MAEEMRDFAAAFGLDYSDSEEPTDEPTEDIEEEETDEVVDEEESEEPEEEEEGEEEPEPEEPQKPKADAKMNYKFAQLRQQNKELTNVLKDVGSILGLENVSDSSAIVEAVKQAVLEQKAKNQGIPVETLQKITQLENLVEENNRIKLEKDTTQSFQELIDEFSLSTDQINEFTQYLIENDLNPLEGKAVDIKAEYLKLHWAEMLTAAKDSAVQAENERREKAKNHAGGAAPSKKGGLDNKEGYEISSMADLDAFLKKQTL